MIESVPETPATPRQPGPLPPFYGRPVPPKPQEPPRYGRWVAVGVTLAFITVLVLLAIIVPRAHRTRIARLNAQARARVRAAEMAYAATAYAVKPNEVMTAVLSRAGFSNGDINRIVPALRYAGFNFRAMLPGDSLFVLGGEGTRPRSDATNASRMCPQREDAPPVRLLYQRNIETVYRIDVESAAVRVSMLLKDVRMEKAFVRGTIASSLYETMMAQGEQPQLIMDYTDVFGWEIDFFSEVQPNDRFAILFERKYCDSACIGYGAILAAAYWGQVGSFAGYRFTDPDGTTDYYNAEGQNLRKTFQKSPLRFSRVSSFFGRRFHPILRRTRQHAGIDYVAPRGTPVEAVSDGRVVSAGWSGGYGRLVAVRHAEGYETRYGHLSGFGKGIRSGASVRQGQVVGYVGSTGVSTGPHLHYEVRKFGSAVNPLRLNPPRRSPVRQAFIPRFQHTRDSLAQEMQARAR
jgi:murein DD-endopeptidase MepM/ murein hydrolase activator NlpD